MKPMRSPVVLHHFRQPAYTRAHEAIRGALVAGVTRALDRPPRAKKALRAAIAGPM